MAVNKSDDLCRRAFLGRAAALGGLGVAAPLGINLAAFSEAAAFDATDYKALVCVFLYGGNDHGDTLIPVDTANYDLYSAIRGGGAGRTAGGIARAQADLAAGTLIPGAAQTLTDDIRYALPPEMTRMKALWDQGRVAVQLNVGTLIAPTTLAQYKAGSTATNPLPPKLFSHNDQQSVWQSGSPEGARVGWGGRIGDLALSSNTAATFTSINASGNAVFLAGQSALQYQVSTTGAVAIEGLTSPRFGGSAAKAALRTLITASSGHTFESEYAKVVSRSIAAQTTMSSALSGVNLATNFNPTGIKNTLAEQLQIVARIIAARNSLGVRRQVFFVSLGGFDTHDYLMRDHPALLAKVDEAMAAFYAATVEMGVADKVTTFTASDFGRTFASNGDGTDHGWGGHHFVMGGDVRGRQFYGTAPHVSITSNDQVGQGRLLPSTATDQYAATLANWFGVQSGEISGILPNIGNFATRNLGFMKA